MKTSRQQQRRSAPGDVAPPVQKYSDRECMLWPSSFCGAISPRCGLTNYSPYAMRYFRISTARAVRRSRSSTRTSCLRSGRSHRDDLAWSPGTSSLPPANSWAGYSTIFGPASTRCRRACGNPLACRDRRRRGRLNGATTRRSCVSTWGNWRTSTVASAADVLVRWWPELRRCKHEPCGVWFLPTHGRQCYHDARCASAARYQRFKPTRNYKAEYARRHDSTRTPARHHPSGRRTRR